MVGLVSVIVVFLVCGGIWLAYVGNQLSTPGAKTVLDTSGVEVFRASVPQGFGYFYFHDGSGFAVNTATREVLLHEGGLTKRLSVGQIRDFQKRWNIAPKYKITSNTMVGASQQVSANRSMARQYYESSGLFVSVADLAKPVFQIRFVDEPTLNRAFELFSQAREGVLV